MNKNKFIEQLELKLKLKISILEKEIISKFFNNSKTKILLKSAFDYDFGKTYELYIAWLFDDKSTNYDDYIVKIENNNKNNKANDGVDIIYPYEKNLYVVQVKTSKMEPDPAKLEKRGNEFIKDLQESDKTPKYIASKWKISKNVIEDMKLKKDDYQLKTIWVSPIGSKKRDKIINYKTFHWGIFEILTMRYFKNPESFLSNKKYEFKIMSDFSNADHKAIIEERNDRIYSLIMPLQISQLYDFLNNKIIQENKLKIESLFPGNVRYYQGNTQIKKSITNTINDTPKDFYKYNNGITIFSKKIFIKNQSGGHTVSFQIQGINIINGQQTVIAIFDACEKMKRNNKDLPKNAYVLLKVFSNLNDQQLSNLSMFTNQQKSIKAFELLSTRKFNTILQEKLIKEGIFYKPKKGKNSFTEQYKKWPQVELKDILKYWYIKEEGDVWVKNKVNKFMEALTFSTYLSKKVYQQYKSIADKFKSMNNWQKVETFKTIANVSVDIKLYKSKKDNTFIVKQSLDMYAYFLLLDRNRAENKKFINFFNNRVLSFSNIFLENDPSKNIANLFKTKKNSGRLFKELLLFFNDL